MGCYGKKYWKQKNHQCTSFYFSEKQKNNRQKRNCKKRLIIILLMAASIPESKMTSQKYDYYDGPCLVTINHMDTELENVFARLKTSKS